MVDKVVRDGKVAVIVSYGYGAGWSTWMGGPLSEQALYSPEIVAWIESGKVGEAPKISDEDYYEGGLSQAEIVWVDEGTEFKVDEYDGSEVLIFKEDDIWSTA